MKAVARLVVCYFTGTPMVRWTTAISLLVLACSYGVLMNYSELLGTGGWRSPAPFELALSAVFWLGVWGGMCGVFMGGSLMPVMLGHFAVAHWGHLLPRARPKLLLSALATVTLVTLLTATLTTAAFSAISGADLRAVFLKAFVVAFLGFSLMYVVLWIVSKARGVMMLAGAMIVIAGLGGPMRYIVNPSTSLSGAAAAAVVVWLLLVLAVVMAPHIRDSIAAIHLRVAQRKAAQGAGLQGAGPVGDVERINLLLGTSRPWLLAAGQIVPIMVATRFIEVRSVWLFYLAILSAMSGAVTSFAAGRSRPLWLRTDWSRDELFGRVELSYWRHNSYSLCVLIVLLVFIGSSLNLRVPFMALGIPLLVLGTAASTYLGLMMTRGIGWWESVLAVATMLVLMVTASMIAEGKTDSTVMVLEGLLAVSALFFRGAAKRRWRDIDWMLCRPDAAARSAG